MLFTLFIDSNNAGAMKFVIGLDVPSRSDLFITVLLSHLSSSWVFCVTVIDPGFDLGLSNMIHYDAHLL